MAKLENLFIGCPVTVKHGNSDVGVVAEIDTSDNTAWVVFSSSCATVDLWCDIEDLRLAPFPDPHKVVAHLDRFA